MEVRSYKDLAVWQRAMELASSAYQLSALLPRDERFGLVSQIRRAAVSVPANIAEGRKRASTKDFLRFLSIAAGSLAELETLVELATRLHSIQSTQVQQRLEAKLSSPSP